METGRKGTCMLFAGVQLFLPLCLGVGLVIGRPFERYFPVLFALGMAAVTLFLTDRLRKEEPSCWLLLLAMPAFLNGVCLLTAGLAGGAAGIVCWACGWALLKHSPGGFLRGLCTVTAVLLTVLLILILPFWGFAQVMRRDTVVKTLPSPEGSYTAIVTSSDQGALGGATTVEVRDNRRSINILLGRFTSSVQLWSGGWGAHETMTLEWEAEDCLEINGLSYAVSGENAKLLAKLTNVLGAEFGEVRVLTYRDTHGGFHGDGTIFVKVQGKCAVPASEYWHPLPVPEEVRRLMDWCRDEAGVPRIPEVKGGYWYFRDRHGRSTDPTQPGDHGSWNFTLALYDAREGVLYYYELDT